MPARWPGTDLPTTPLWSARSAPSPGQRLHPLCRRCPAIRGLDRTHTHVQKFPEIGISSRVTRNERFSSRRQALGGLVLLAIVLPVDEIEQRSQHSQSNPTLLDLLSRFRAAALRDFGGRVD